MTENTPTLKRVYSTGDRPVSPIIKNDRVYVLADIRKEEATEHGYETENDVSPLDNWSYLQEEMTLAEYFARVKELQDETNWEQDAAIFELAAMVAGGL